MSRRPPRAARIADRRTRRAFTLAELVISLGIMGIIMAGLGSAMLIASHALPDAGDPSTAILESAGIVDQIAEELSSAIWVREHTPTTIEFTVPDRDGDEAPERVRYAWSGTVGGSLTRQYNGGAVVNVIDRIHDFRLDYTLVTLTEEYEGPVVESDEILLSSQTSVGETRDKQIERDRWYGQHIQPVLPDDAATWSVTRVWFQAKQDGSPVEAMWARIREADADDLPADAILDEVLVEEWQLPTHFDWVAVDFDDARGRGRDSTLCFVLEHTGDGGPAAKMLYDAEIGPGRLKSLDAGATWVFQSGRSLYHYIYGRYTTPSPPQTAMRTYMTDVAVSLQPTDTPGDTVVTAARMLNTPELLSGLWEADFESDPSLDHNGDGEADWLMLYGGDFEIGDLLDRAWRAENHIVSWPKHEFPTLTTATARMKTTRLGATGAIFGVSADTGNGTHAAIRVFLTRDAGNTQSLELAEKLTDHSMNTLIKISGLSLGFVEVRLVIDPDRNTVALSVDNVHRGTFTYTPTVPSGDERFAIVGGAGAAFDRVSVRASE